MVNILTHKKLHIEILNPEVLLFRTDSLLHVLGFVSPQNVGRLTSHTVLMSDVKTSMTWWSCNSETLLVMGKLFCLKS